MSIVPLTPFLDGTCPGAKSKGSEFVQPNAADAADRQWLCAVYANATGQADTARQLAEAAAQSKPEYREQLSLLLSS